MLHCTAHPCNMNGSNHLAESDRQPMWLCPQCAAKLCEATDADPEQRCRELIRFFEKVEFDEEARFQRSSLAAMRGSR
jgi:archaemetzincin